MINEKSLNDLAHNIQSKRFEMYSVANKYGFSDERTVQNSQELDKLIMQYQNYTKVVVVIALCI